ncbi:MAG: hypothetical protein WD232_08695 [Acidimicrobiales bacterium]
MRRTPRTITAAAFAATLALGGAACSDEDGDGATTDEEIGELDEQMDEGGEQLGEEIEGGEKELEGEG